MWWLKLVAPIITGAGSLFFIWRWIKKHYATLKPYYNIVCILVDAIEQIETTTGYMPDQLVTIAKFIKGLINKSLSKEDRSKLNDILAEKKYLNKGGGEK